MTVYTLVCMKENFEWIVGVFSSMELASKFQDAHNSYMKNPKPDYEIEEHILDDSNIYLYNGELARMPEGWKRVDK